MLATAKAVSTTVRYRYTQASKEAQRLAAVSQKQYLAFAKQNALLPLNPSSAYHNKGWNGWLPFLGLQSFSYDQAVTRLKELGIVDQKTYHLFDGDFRLPPNPDVFYADKGWKSWASFFGKADRSATKKDIFYSYDQTVLKIRECRITNRYQYRRLCLLDTCLPTGPDSAYKDKGWISWDAFWGKK